MNHVAPSLALALLALGCTGSDGSDSATWIPWSDTSDTSQDTVDTSPDTSDTAPGTKSSVDVLVIGSGPAGISAAWAAAQAGAEVRVVEMESMPGGGLSARRFYGAGTRWQAEADVTDSPEAALGDWAALTGGDPEDPWVQRLVHESVDVLEWLEDWGAVFVELSDSGEETRRLHYMESGLKHLGALYDEMGDQIFVTIRADDLIVEDGRVVGARVTSLSNDLQQEARAQAVVVATGGFGRSLKRVAQDRPELAGAQMVYESWPHAQGMGLDMAEAAGANFQNAGAMGVYLHAFADWRDGRDGEAIIMDHLSYGIVVDLDGQRVMDESRGAEFGAHEALAGASGGRVFALFSEQTLSIQTFTFLPTTEDVATLTLDDVLASGALQRYDDAEAAAGALGLDAAGLAATLAQYDAYDAAGADDDFGKDASYLRSFGSGALYAVELGAGPAKGFGGVELSEDAGVLGADGAAIPGLYAAGEVAGMLGTPAVGRGFDGSITAVYLTGLTAGHAAAEYALDRAGR